MLSPTSAVRLSNDEVERRFALHKDVIALGVVNDRGIFNPQTRRAVLKLYRFFETVVKKVLPGTGAFIAIKAGRR